MLNIERIKPKIVEALMPVSPIKIILFGSYAYGNLTEDSDLDVLVVEEKVDDRWKEIERIQALLKEIRVPKDMLLESKAFFQSHTGKEWINTAWYDANTYGEVLYEKK